MWKFSVVWKHVFYVSFSKSSTLYHAFEHAVNKLLRQANDVYRQVTGHLYHCDQNMLSCKFSFYSCEF